MTATSNGTASSDAHAITAAEWRRWYLVGGSGGSGGTPAGRVVTAASGQRAKRSAAGRRSAATGTPSQPTASQQRPPKRAPSADFLTYAHEIAAHLPGGAAVWQVEIVKHDWPSHGADDRQRDCHLIFCGDGSEPGGRLSGAGLRLKVNEWRQAGRLVVRCIWPTNEQGGDHRPNGSDVPGGGNG